MVVVVAVALNGIAWYLVLIGHRHRKGHNADGIIDVTLEGGRDHAVQPPVDLMALVDLAIALRVLITQRKSMAAQPHVITPTALGPLCAWVTGMRHLPRRHKARVNAL